MAEGFPGPHECGVEVNGLIAIKTEAVALLDRWHIRRHRIYKATDAPHDGNRAVAHRQQLADAARLKP